MGFERFSPVERLIEVAGRPVRVWRPPDMEALIDLVAFESDERIPYWADVWESAIVLAEELSQLDGRGLSLLELGCGLRALYWLRFSCPYGGLKKLLSNNCLQDSTSFK
jgi:hypothetical protein